MIHIENLSKEYDLAGGTDKQGPVVAADRLTLEIEKGEIYGLVGPNGAGKTTTLKMVCGLLVPTSGRVLVNGVDVEVRPEEAQRYIGYLADFFALYDDLKVWEYLDFFGHAYKLPSNSVPARIEYLLLLLGLQTKRDSYIDGLSRGMKQRLGIARAIIHDPPVLVLDEPTAGLDPQARIDFKKMLNDLNKAGKTILVTSHLLGDLQEICTSIAILEKGRLVKSGRLEKILEEGSVAPGPQGKTAGQRVRVKLATPGFNWNEWLGQHPQVSGLAIEPSGALFTFSGTDAELAELMKALIGAGAPIFGVEKLTDSLEQVYSRLTKGEVM
ncbi:MAG: ABC transporter ATP-binding protein [Candidatus Acidiferrales bacterium]